MNDANNDDNDKKEDRRQFQDEVQFEIHFEFFLIVSSSDFVRQFSTFPQFINWYLEKGCFFEHKWMGEHTWKKEWEKNLDRKFIDDTAALIFVFITSKVNIQM